MCPSKSMNEIDLMHQEPRLRVDTHVHYYDCFEPEDFLTTAAEALLPDKVAPETGKIHGALCLTETAGTNWFARLMDGIVDSDGQSDQGWQIMPTLEDVAVVARTERDERLAIVAGRQIISDERLEVLALGYRGDGRNGGSARSIIDRLAKRGAIPILPWGVGKWTGQRKRVVIDLLENPSAPFLLGDNGGRLSIISEPKIFQKAREHGVGILPGSDILPFPRCLPRLGSYGIEWPTCISAETPFEELSALIWHELESSRPFGRLESLPSFLRNQTAIQLRRLTKRRQ